MILQDLRLTGIAVGIEFMFEVCSDWRILELINELDSEIQSNLVSCLHISKLRYFS